MCIRDRETSGDSNEGFVQMSADELLDRFVNGEVSAHCLYEDVYKRQLSSLRQKLDRVKWVRLLQNLQKKILHSVLTHIRKLVRQSLLV